MKVSFLKKEDTDPQLKISGMPLQEVQTAKILGVNISADLKWSTHVSQMLKKGNGRLYNYFEITEAFQLAS